ncbi:MAG: hypothetical protein LBF22_06000 [Deltaproteobacteria bacterium]|nr:hypothetical protein [Deltaproteobacteria bacterium]
MLKYYNFLNTLSFEDKIGLAGLFSPFFLERATEGQNIKHLDNLKNDLLATKLELLDRLAT